MRARAVRIAAIGLMTIAFVSMSERADACGTALTTQRVASGLSSPVFAGSPPGDTSRLFIVQQGGAIRILDLTTNTLLPTAFIQISLVSGGEQGLLGLAFDPNYASNHHFYVSYTKTASTHIISRWTTRSDNPNLADTSSELIILSYAQPQTNHNGGWIAFGPDGYLYAGTGDGGGAGDTNNHAQTITNERLGKILRLDVSNSTQGSPYAIPPTNPFVGRSGDDEIWAYGMRNPWRDSFDRLTGDLYIGDVGQSAWEEIDFQPAGSAGGQNYGWHCYEGNHPYNTTGCAPSSTMTFPIYEYSHSDGCATVGGYVYRGARIWDLRGTYFFSDNCTSQIWTFRYDGVNLTDFRNRTSEVAPGGGLSIDSVSSFGEDANGELYICDLDGEVYKIVPNGPVIGDMNGDGLINNQDIDAFVLALFDPAAYQQQYGYDANVIGDINCDGVINNQDIDPWVALLFGGV